MIYYKLSQSLSLDEEPFISFLTNGMESPSGCSILLIAGKYVEKADEVMKRMDDIAEQVNFIPFAAYVFDRDAIIDSSLRFDFSFNV